MPRVFISYRREDATGQARLLRHRLVDEFGAENVFMDLDSIEIGKRWTDVVDKWVGKCDILLALVGRDWLAAAIPPWSTVG